MKTVEITRGELALLAMTRVLLGAGVVLLVSDRLIPDRRRPVGGVLLAVGLLTTLPLALDICGPDCRKVSGASGEQNGEI